MNMWKVHHDLNARGQWQLKIVHLNTIVHAAHLIGIASSSFIPYELNHMNVLDAFKTYYVNKFIDTMHTRLHSSSNVQFCRGINVYHRGYHLSFEKLQSS